MTCFNSSSSRASTGIEPMFAKSYPSALAARVLPLGRVRAHHLNHVNVNVK